MRINDAISGVMLIALSCAMIAMTLTFPPFPGQKYGPSLFPQVLGAGLIVCGLILVARGLAQWRRGSSWLALAPWTGERWRLVSFLMIPGLVLLYILGAETIGFLPFAFAILTVLFLWFRVRPVVALPVAAVATWMVWWFFGTLMRVPLPRGLLTNIL
jgi:putative tricarboxylic transport membrane protein